MSGFESEFESEAEADTETKTETESDSVCVSPYQYFPSSNLLYFCLCLLPCEQHRPADNPTNTLTIPCPCNCPFHFQLPSCAACVVHAARFLTTVVHVCKCMCVCVFGHLLYVLSHFYGSAALWHRFLFFFLG